MFPLPHNEVTAGRQSCRRLLHPKAHPPAEGGPREKDLLTALLRGQAWHTGVLAPGEASGPEDHPRRLGGDLCGEEEP